MNFLSAIKHAAIDYGIRRKAWNGDAVLCLGEGSQSCELFWVGKRSSATSVMLLGPSLTHDLTAEDIMANDWEVI